MLFYDILYRKIRPYIRVLLSSNIVLRVSIYTLLYYSHSPWEKKIIYFCRNKVERDWKEK